MVSQIELPWPGPLNWRALAPFRHVVARRIGDRGEWLIGAGLSTGPFSEPSPEAFPLVGYASYDLKNAFEALASRHPAGDGFALCRWWSPRFLVYLGRGKAVLHAAGEHLAEGSLMLANLLAGPEHVPELAPGHWVRTTDQGRYLEQVRKLLGHIHRGDIYEVNYCTQRTADLPGFDPWAAFHRLLHHSDAPFAGLLRDGDQFALCASPERYLWMEGGRITTQPMKGTRPRGATGPEDAALAAELAQDQKERSENVMALDVARNDLSRIATPGSVRVEELCAVKTFPSVHQMISTASAHIRPGIGPMDILRATFPMASMTGAPKVRAMELIEDMEDMRRGLFSGSIGFFLPDGTADLNVVIRTVTWDANTGRASLMSGGAITAGSDPASEFAECEHKARTVLNAFGHAC